MASVGQPPNQVDLGRADAYGQSFADVYDHWYEGVTDAEATAEFAAARTSVGPILEIGVGSGRLAIPLAARGYSVIGLDGSAAMLAHVPKFGVPKFGVPKFAVPTADGSIAASAGRLHLVQADMRALPLSGRFGLVLIAFNTLFNLPSQSDQAGLLAAISRLLEPDGNLVIEALDASPLLAGPPDSVGVRTAGHDSVVVTATQLDPNQQTMTGQHLEIDGGGIRLRPWQLRWLTPDQLDGAAAEAGLGLVERYGSWAEDPFTESSETHISVYRPTNDGLIPRS